MKESDSLLLKEKLELMVELYVAFFLLAFIYFLTGWKPVSDSQLIYPHYGVCIISQL